VFTLTAKVAVLPKHPAALVPLNEYVLFDVGEIIIEPAFDAVLHV